MNCNGTDFLVTSLGYPMRFIRANVSDVMAFTINTILFAIRHGETDWNAEGRFQGHTDIALNKKGKDQAVKNGIQLRSMLAAEVLPLTDLEFFSSPLTRSCATMGIVRRVLGLPADEYRVDDRLREAAFGDWEGLTTSDVKQQFPLQRKARKANRWTFRPPGGQSFADLADEIASFLAEMDFRTPKLVVSHSGTLRVLAGILEGLSEEESMAIAVPHDRVLVWRGNQRVFS